MVGRSPPFIHTLERFEGEFFFFVFVFFYLWKSEKMSQISLRSLLLLLVPAEKKKHKWKMLKKITRTWTNHNDTRFWLIPNTGGSHKRSQIRLFDWPAGWHLLLWEPFWRQCANRVLQADLFFPRSMLFVRAFWCAVEQGVMKEGSLSIYFYTLWKM